MRSKCSFFHSHSWPVDVAPLLHPDHWVVPWLPSPEISSVLFVAPKVAYMLRTKHWTWSLLSSHRTNQLPICSLFTPSFLSSKCQRETVAYSLHFSLCTWHDQSFCFYPEQNGEQNLERSATFSFRWHYPSTMLLTSLSCYIYGRWTSVAASGNGSFKWFYLLCVGYWIFFWTIWKALISCKYTEVSLSILPTCLVVVCAIIHGVLEQMSRGLCSALHL